MGRAGVVALFTVAIGFPLALAPGANAANTGAVAQKAAPNGCWAELPGMTCSDGLALDGATAVLVSPDGRNAYAASYDSSAVAVFDRSPATGELTQKPGTAGCWSEDGTAGACQNGVALTNAVEVAVSPDGRNVYVVSTDAIAIFDRNPATGALTQKSLTAGCISETGTSGACQDGKALIGPEYATVSPDGRSVYVGSPFSHAVAVFDRDTASGELTQKAGVAGCTSDDGTGGLCRDGVALSGAVGVSVSPDGTSVYVASRLSDAVAVFDRDAATGELMQKAGTAGCISDNGTAGTCQDGVALFTPVALAASPDGRNLYVISSSAGSVTIFDRNPATGALTQKPGTAGCISNTGSGGACRTGVALINPRAVAVSPDGRSVYAATLGFGAVAVLDRSTATGELAQKAAPLGCVSVDGMGGACAVGSAMSGTTDVAVSPDGRSVYSASSDSDAVVVFDRDTGPSKLQQKPAPTGCVSDNGTSSQCADGRGLQGAVAVAMSPDGRNVYSAAATDDAVAIFDRNPVIGGLTQQAGTAGCWSKDGAAAFVPGQCQDGVALNGAGGVAVSPDGRNVYVVSRFSNAVSIFDRDAASGALMQKAGIAGCWSEDGTDDGGPPGACGDGMALNGARSVSVSPDGLNVYVTSSPGSNAIAIFDRNATTGALTQKPGVAGCASHDGTGSACQVAAPLVGANGLGVSPDGRTVYVAAATSDAVVIFDRDVSSSPARGELTRKSSEAGCIAQVGSTGVCADGRALDGAIGIDLSRDGRRVYVASRDSGAVAVLDRNTADGTLGQNPDPPGCTADVGATEGCTDGVALADARGVAISPDGRGVYVGAANEDALAALDRNVENGSLTRPAGTAACLSENGTGGACQDGVGLVAPSGVAVSPGGDNVYVATEGTGGVAILDRTLDHPPLCSNLGQNIPHNTTTAVALVCSDPDTGETLTRSVVDPPANGTLGAIDQGAGTVAYTPNSGFGGADTFTFRTSDGTNVSNVATASLSVAAAPAQQGGGGGGGGPAPAAVTAISLEPAAIGRDAGVDHTVAVLVTQDGQPVAARAVRWRVEGSHPRSEATVTTGADGRASVSWLGQTNGIDTLTAYADVNGDGTRQDGSEPQTTATVTWRNGLPESIKTADSLDGLPRPTAFRNANFQPVGNGPVTVKLPAGAAGAAQSVTQGFIPLRKAAQLPVGTIVNTVQGRSRVVAAASARGTETSTADFYRGAYRFTQPRSARGIAEMVLQGGSFRSCSRARRSGAESSQRRSRRVVRRLWGNGRGKFRTRGRYSAATVRGTEWQTVDRCDGTLTQVRSGTVRVRDFRRKRTVNVKAPRSYLASGPRRP